MSLMEYLIANPAQIVVLALILGLIAALAITLIILCVQKRKTKTPAFIDDPNNLETESFLDGDPNENNSSSKQ